MTLKATQAFHYDVAIDRLLSEEEVAKQEARKARSKGEGLSVNPPPPPQWCVRVCLGVWLHGGCIRGGEG
jgi:hypothetical protein